MTRRYTTSSSKETQSLPKTILPIIFRKKPSRKATVVALSGELGAGKTTFTQGCFKALGIRKRAVSPTFIIIRAMDVRSVQFDRVYHMDCYRLHHPQELLDLGFREILKNPRHLVFIEWPELMKKYLPKNTAWLTLAHGNKKNERTVTMKLV